MINVAYLKFSWKSGIMGGRIGDVRLSFNSDCQFILFTTVRRC